MSGTDEIRNEEDADQIRYEEEIEIREARWDSAMIVTGELLLWVDLLPLAFAYSSIRDGSWFWVWWVLSQGALGGLMLIGGAWHQRRHVS